MEDRHARWLGLAIVLALLTGAGAAWAADAGARDSTEGRTAAPQVGDEVRYAWNRSYGGEPRQGALTFVWNGTEERETRTGVERELAVVEGGFVFEQGRREGVPVELTYARGSADPVTVTTELRFAFSVPLGVAGTSWEAELGERSYVGFDDTVALCLPRAGWQNATLDALEGRPLGDVCPGLDVGAGDGARLERVGTREVRNRTAVGYEARIAGEPASTVTVWLLEGLPYPIELKVETADRAETFRLTGYHPGSTPVDAAAQPRPDRTVHVDVETGSLPRWGIREGDPDAYPYPPGEAIATLRGDPTLAGFHAYLRENPDARVVAYTYDVEDESPGPADARTRAWCFIFNTPDGEGYETCARETDRASLLDEGAGPPEPVERTNASRRDLPPLDPAELPDRSIRVSDAIAVWRARDPDADRLTDVGAFLQPSLVDGERDPPDGAVLVGQGGGYSALETEGDPVARSESAGNFTAYVAELESGASRVAFSTHLARTTELGSSAGTGGQVPTTTVDEGWTGAGILWPLAGGLGLLGLLAVLLQGPAGRFLTPLYHRITGAEILDHPIRETLYETVREEPGLHQAELARRTDASEGTVDYHLSVLEREGFVESRRLEGFRRYFERGALTEAEQEEAALLRSGSTETVLTVVEETPGLNQGEIAERASVTDPAVHEIVTRLEEAGLVERERDGRSVLVFPA